MVKPSARLGVKIRGAFPHIFSQRNNASVVNLCWCSAVCVISLVCVHTKSQIHYTEKLGGEKNTSFWKVFKRK